MISASTVQGPCCLSQESRSYHPTFPAENGGLKRTQLTIVITVLTVYCYTNISTAQLTIVITVLIVYCVIPISVHQFIKNLMKEFDYGVNILGSKNDSELLALTPATYIGNAVQSHGYHTFSTFGLNFSPIWIQAYTEKYERSDHIDNYVYYLVALTKL
eukprot:g46396.t1